MKHAACLLLIAARKNISILATLHTSVCISATLSASIEIRKDANVAAGFSLKRLLVSASLPSQSQNALPAQKCKNLYMPTLHLPEKLVAHKMFASYCSNQHLTERHRKAADITTVPKSAILTCSKSAIGSSLSLAILYIKRDCHWSNSNNKRQMMIAHFQFHER